ncbi:hypothetical protein M2459_003707 [Parabacteroides sp. PF5-5]|uniref:hypothetical protein n=1 Tax=unclassified Parabacteroides TaxID=2649774 RepID=UPI00247314ED|nr:MULTISPECIES: hypothetical protein [unclassified Parabacteroides]MDH6307020.1 hypothetical protein [Parabacteroides sp. PH5-39]MDH6317935.1 hypothetical protein [Parabacteroides sp. PF5-13]MDH6321661.1 hypothetical protein [Parabacteroides sp. PH5-13]MDH6325412.1 hypothetical protein [Parabacteroides sp. PH5-8]MDH6329123.1 hypothetical protein [Parabacteroides sp. PH5-41]
MKTIHKNNPLRFLTVILLLACCLPAWANTPDRTKKKEINQSFNVSNNDLLRVDNRYGNITITHWNKNEVSIRVVIEVKANSDSQAQEALDRVNVELGKSSNTVSAITSLRSQTGWNNNNNRLTIDYYISMPSKLSTVLSQKYGNINMPEKNEGKSMLEVKYGNIKAGSFTASLNIDAGYSNVELDDVQDLNLDISYCGNVKVNNGESMRIDGKYSNISIRNVKKLEVDKKYSNLKVGNTENVAISMKYSECNIDRMKDQLQASSMDYSTLNIKEVASGFKRIEARARYGNLNIHIPSNASFKVDAKDMKYGNIDINGFNVTHSNVENKVNHHYQVNGGGSSVILFEGNNYSNIKIRTL